jgi:hypothetical protein
MATTCTLIDVTPTRLRYGITGALGDGACGAVTPSGGCVPGPLRTLLLAAAADAAAARRQMGLANLAADGEDHRVRCYFQPAAVGGFYPSIVPAGAGAAPTFTAQYPAFVAGGAPAVIAVVVFEIDRAAFGPGMQSIY